MRGKGNGEEHPSKLNLTWLQKHGINARIKTHFEVVTKAWDKCFYQKNIKKILKNRRAHQTINYYRLLHSHYDHVACYCYYDYCYHNKQIFLASAESTQCISLGFFHRKCDASIDCREVKCKYPKVLLTKALIW